MAVDITDNGQAAIRKTIIALGISMEDRPIKMAATHNLGRNNTSHTIMEKAGGSDMNTTGMMISTSGFDNNLRLQLLPSAKFYDGYKPHKTL